MTLTLCRTTRRHLEPMLMDPLTDLDGMTPTEALALRVATQVRRHVAEQLAEVVGPLRDEVAALRERVAALEHQQDVRDANRVG